MRRLGAGLLLLAAFLSSGGTAAQAQTTLVSNTGQNNSGAKRADSDEIAQAFGTGSDMAGYDFDSIVLSLGLAPTGTGTLTVTVREDASGDPSGTALYTLTTPDPIAGGSLNTFAAPSGATLDANTTYWVVVSYSSDTGGPNWWRTLLSNGIDAGGAAGWTIDSPYKIDSRTDPNGWVEDSPNRAMKIQVKGTAKGTFTQTADGATWTLTGETSVAAGGTYTYTLTLTSGTKPLNEYAGFHLPNTADNQDKLGTDPADCTSPKQFCISFRGATAVEGIWDDVQGHDTRYTVLSDTSPHTLTATFAVAADAPDGSSIEFGAINSSGLPRDDGLTITVDATATLSTDATLSALTVDDGTIEHTINLATTPYTVDVGNAVEEVTLTATTTHLGASVSAVTLGGTAIADTDFTDGITVPSLAEGDNVIVVTVMAEDGSTTETYTVTVTREGTPATAVTIVAEHDSIGGGLEDLKFTLTREGATTGELDVTVTIVQDESWLGDSDLSHDVTFEADSATAELTIAASEFSFAPSTTGDLTATVTGDGIDGGSETVAIISTSEPPITISYDESEYTFAEDATDEEIYGLATLDAAYPRGPSQAFRVSLGTREGTATTPEDFALYANDWQVTPDQFERDVDTDPLVARTLYEDIIVNDEIQEGSEHFVMLIEFSPGLRTGLTRFAHPDGSTCAGAPGCTPEYTVNITDDDLAELSLSAAPSSIDEEDDDGTTGTAENVSTVKVEITNGKTFGVDQTVTLTFTGTATRGTHYSVSPGDADTNTAGHQVVLVKETASVEVTVTATGNDTADGHRTVTVAADLDGTAIGSSTITIVDDETTTTTAPEIVTDGVEVTSTPDTGDTYRLGETIEITVTFDNAVTVNTSGGTPRIELILGSGNKWAEYSSGSGGTALVFTYDVQSGDRDTDGIGIATDRLELRGGTITAAADDTVNASIFYDFLATQPGHKVDGSTVPGAPTSLTATANGSTRIDLSWTAPADNGGSTITGYRIEVSPNGTSSWTDREANTGTATTTYAHTGLSAGTTRHYRVSAINSAGTGGPSSTANATTDDAATTAPAIVTDGVQVTSTPAAGDTYRLGETIEITVTFDNAVTVNASSVGPPRIQFRLTGSQNRWAEYSNGSGGTALKFTYVVQSGDVDDDGIWLPADFLRLRSGTITATADATVDAILTYDEPGLQPDHKVDGSTSTVPGAPTSLTATASGTSTINLSWTAPSNDGGASISGYRIEVSPNGNSNWSNRVANTGSTTTSYGHTGLSAGTTRHYRVSAINSVGTGAASNVDDATTDATTTTVPGAPTGLTATASGSNRIDLSWTAPSSDGGASISGYRIEVSPNGNSNWSNRVANTGSSSTSYSHTGLDAGTTRHYRVSAINSAGTGAASNVDDATTANDTNKGPLVLTVEAVEETVTEGEPVRYRIIMSRRTSGAVVESSFTYKGKFVRNPNSSVVTGVSSHGGKLYWEKEYETLDDAIDEKNGSFTVRIGKPDADLYDDGEEYTVGSPSSATVTILDNDPEDTPPVPIVSLKDVSVDEGPDAWLVFPVKLNFAAVKTARIEWETLEGTGSKGAKAGKDFVGASGTLVFSPGEKEKTVRVKVIDDTEPEGTEVMLLYLTSDDAVINGFAVGTIKDNDAASDAADAALAVAEGLTPDEAVGALFGERRLSEARLAALDLLGNRNGRYDLGDLLAWIERCRRGEARCGSTSAGSGPPSAAGLLGAAAAGRPWRRTRRRGSGRPGRRPIRTARLRGRFAGYALATLLAVTMTMTLSCTEGSVAPPAYVPDPGFLTVEWSGPAAHRDVGVLLEFEGPAIDAVRAPGFELYESSSPGPQRIVVAGSLRPGPFFVQFRVSDRNRFALYSIRVLQVTGEDYGLRDPTEYRAVVVMN